MRFDRVFEDLEGQMAHLEQEEIRAVSEDLTRAERAQLALADRLRGALGSQIVVLLGESARVHGTVADSGSDWVLLEGAGQRRALVPLHAICALQGLPPRARPPAPSIPPPASLTGRLRALARDRRAVLAETAAGRMTGRISAVGADWMEMRILPTGEAAAGAAGSVVTIPVRSLLQIVDG